jgi:5'-nucleotidase
MRLAGKVIDPAKRYRVTVNSFLAQGGDGFTVLRDAPERTEGMLDIEAFAGNITRESSIAKPLAPPARLERVVGNACE